MEDPSSLNTSPSQYPRITESRTRDHRQRCDETTSDPFSVRPIMAVLADGN